MLQYEGRVYTSVASALTGQGTCSPTPCGQHVNESRKLVVTSFQNVVIKGEEQNHQQQQQTSLNGSLSQPYQIHSKQAEWKIYRVDNAPFPG